MYVQAQIEIETSFVTESVRKDAEMFQKVSEMLRAIWDMFQKVSDNKTTCFEMFQKCVRILAANDDSLHKHVEPALKLF